MKELSTKQILLIIVLIVSAFIFSGCQTTSQTPIPVVYDIEGNQPQ